MTALDWAAIAVSCWLALSYPAALIIGRMIGGRRRKER